MQAVTVDRDKYIGGSDIPIIMGISSFKSRFDLLLEKAGYLENDFTGNEYTEYGNIMEPKIRQYINEATGRNFVEGKHIEGDIRCHTDGEDETSILEIKTTSQIHDTLEEYKVYLVQLLFYMYHTKKEYGMLAVYERPSDFNTEFDKSRLTIYQIGIASYEQLLEDINNAVDKFRVDLKKVKLNPFITEEQLIPKDLTELSNKVLELETKLIAYDELKKQYDTFKEQLRQAMIDNNVKKWTTPNNTQITLIADTPDKVVSKFNEDKFKEENEELYIKYIEDKVQKGRKGSIRITPPKESA